MKKENFEAIVTQYQDKIFRICQAYAYYPGLTDDLYQEVLLNLWSSLSSFKGEAKFTTWMYRVTVNTAISFNRKEKTYQGKNMGEYSGQLADSNDEKNEKLETESQLERMHQAISELPAEERLIIGLYLEDLAYKEIAEVIGATTNLVGVKINRIKERLTKKLTN